MLLNLFNEMRAAKVPVSVRELLDLINALKHNVVFADMDEFYFLSRTILVKDERHFDKFDRAFGAYFKGLENLNQHIEALIPDEWLRKEFERSLTDEERAKIEHDAAGMSFGGYIGSRLLDPDWIAPRRRGKFPVKDHRALAQLLAMLGQSRLANNVNQLAKAANTGSLPVTPETEEALLTAVHEVTRMRQLLIEALDLDARL